MADDITYTSTNPAGLPDTTKQATDEHATRGHMPIVKLALSADGSATLITADADGLLVNLGTNNDVVVSATNLDIRDLSSASDSVTVVATNLDIRDLSAASDSVAVHGDVGALDQIDLTNTNPLAVAVVDGDGTQITSFGGGTQYTEGDTDASITGTAMLWEDASDTLRAVSAAKPLPVALPKPATATLANVASSTTSVTLQASNTARLGLTIYNDSSKVLFVKFGSSASSTSFTVKLLSDAYYEMPFGYTGIVTGVWTQVNGAARMTEITL